MYGHCHTGFGALLLTFIALLKGFFGFVFKSVGWAHPHVR